MINALPDGEVTPMVVEAPDQATDNQDVETQPEKSETEPTEAKNAQHAVQLARERENQERAAREQAQKEAEEMRQRLEALELQNLSETDAYRLKAERAEARLQELEREKTEFELKERYRSWLTEKEAEHPKATKILKRQLDKGIVPIGGDNPAEFEQSFLDFAADVEETQSEAKPASSNPTFTTPDIDVDITKLSIEEMRKVLPKKEDL